MQGHAGRLQYQDKDYFYLDSLKFPYAQVYIIRY